MKIPHYTAIILAGGLSSRMNKFKPLLPLGDSTVIEHGINLFRQSGIDVVLVGVYRSYDVPDDECDAILNDIYHVNPRGIPCG